MWMSLPERVVVSAAARMAEKFSSTHRPKSLACRASRRMNTGARCIACSTTVALTPPHSASSRIPRL